MSKLDNKFLKDYSITTLRDAVIASPLEEDVIRYDFVSSKWKNFKLSIKNSLKVFRRNFDGDIIAESDTLTLLASPRIDGALIVNGEVYII